jgi:hypothetical protein
MPNSDDEADADPGLLLPAELKQLKNLEAQFQALRVQLHVASAFGLKRAAGQFGAPNDVFAIVFLDGAEVGRTAVRRSTEAPTWENEVFELQLPEEPSTALVRVELWADGAVGGGGGGGGGGSGEAGAGAAAAAFLGEVVLRGSDELLGLGPTPKELPLQPQPRLGGEPSACVGGALRLARVSLRRLVVHVDEARELVQTDDFGGENDVYALLRLHTPSRHEEVGRTPTYADSLCPEWGGSEEATFRLLLPVELPTTRVCVEFWAEEMDGEDTFLGEICVLYSKLDWRGATANFGGTYAMLLGAETVAAAAEGEEGGGGGGGGGGGAGGAHVVEIAKLRNGGAAPGGTGDDGGGDGHGDDGSGDGASYAIERPLGRRHEEDLAARRQRCVGGSGIVRVFLEQDSPDRNPHREVVALRRACKMYAPVREWGAMLVSAAGLAMVDAKAARNPDPFARVFWRGQGGAERLLRESEVFPNSVNPVWRCEPLVATLPLCIAAARLRIEFWDLDRGQYVCLGEAVCEGAALLGLGLNAPLLELPILPQAGDARQAKYVVPGRGVARLRRAEFAHLQLRVESATDLADTDTADHASAATASVVRASVSFNGAHIADTRRVANDQEQHAVTWRDPREVFPLVVPLRTPLPSTLVEVWDTRVAPGTAEDGDEAFCGQLELEPDELFALPSSALAGSLLAAPRELERKNAQIKYSKFVAGELVLSKAVDRCCTVRLCDLAGLLPHGAAAGQRGDEVVVFVKAFWRGHEVWQSTRVAGTGRPRWQWATFKVLLPAGQDSGEMAALAAAGAAGGLRLEVWAEDHVAGDDFLGECQLRGAELLDAAPCAGFALRPKAGVDPDLMRHVGGEVFLAWGDAEPPQQSEHEAQMEAHAKDLARLAAEGDGEDEDDDGSGGAARTLPKHWKYAGTEQCVWLAAVFQERYAQVRLLARYSTSAFSFFYLLTYFITTYLLACLLACLLTYLLTYLLAHALLLYLVLHLLHSLTRRGCCSRARTRCAATARSRRSSCSRRARARVASARRTRSGWRSASARGTWTGTGATT